MEPQITNHNEEQFQFFEHESYGPAQKEEGICGLMTSLVHAQIDRQHYGEPVY